jgi:hypothetical protein
MLLLALSPWSPLLSVMHGLLSCSPPLEASHPPPLLHADLQHLRLPHSLPESVEPEVSRGLLALAFTRDDEACSRGGTSSSVEVS